jgi:hypothetical protein
MKGKTIFGALLVSVALCSQGFGFELLDRMLGLNGGGCGECKACAKVACCEKAGKCCCPEPACCEKACRVKPTCCAKPTCCEKTCGCEKCRKCRATPVRDLFDNIKDLFEAKGYTCETKCCKAAKCCCPEPVCCGKVSPKACEKVACESTCGRVKKLHKGCSACGPATCEKVAQPKCHKLYRRPVVELLESLFAHKCGKCGGCEVGCEVCGGCSGAAPAPAAAPAKAPAKAPEAAPLPAAPKADPSAALPSGIYQDASSLVRN